MGSWDGFIYCLTADSGDTVWTYPTGARVQPSPAVFDGKVYVGSYNEHVYCLDADSGDVVWQFHAPGPGTSASIGSSPAVAYGNVYIGSYNNKVYCLPLTDPDNNKIIEENEVVWNYPTGGNVESSSTERE